MHVRLHLFDFLSIINFISRTGSEEKKLSISFPFCSCRNFTFQAENMRESKLKDQFSPKYVELLIDILVPVVLFVLSYNGSRWNFTCGGQSCKKIIFKKLSSSAFFKKP